MRNLYSVTSIRQAIRDLVRVMRDLKGNLPPLPAVIPDKIARVVRTTPDGVRELTMMRWGFPPPPHLSSKAPVTNVRNANSSWWRPWMLAGHRCLMPVTSFCE
jgi:putative SOS response-associated peptidase YedK